MNNQPTNTTTALQWVAYYRVSTKKQGLGLDAQRARVEAAAKEVGAEIICSIEEKESGKECNRPGLSKAMAEAKRNGAILVVAKHDRLTRDLGFASDLFKNSGIRFNILNLPPEATTDPLLLGVYWGLADREAQLISERTKAALAALKAKGVKLGRPDAATCITPEMVAKSAEVRKRKADENTANIAASNEVRRYLSTNPTASLRNIADHLNEAGLYTPSGVYHTAQSVKRLKARYNL